MKWNPEFKSTVGFGLGVAGLAVPLILQGCLMTAQKPDEIFESGQLPAALEEVANPDVTVGPEYVSVLDGGVRVAVIDNGVDYRHPYLAHRISYTVENGRITGAGKDVLGKDGFPHPNLIDGRIFAFGAEITPEGKISNPLHDPMGKLTELSRRFGEIYTEEFQKKAEQLAGTFFTRYTSESLHLLGAFSLLQKKTSHSERHRQAKELGVLADLNVRENGNPVLKEQIEEMPDGERRKLFAERWSLGEDGTPANAMLRLSIMRGMDTFMEVLEAAFTRFDAESRFMSRYFEPYYQYRYTELTGMDRTSSRESLNERFASDLFSAWHRVQTDYLGEDPVVGAVTEFCDLLNDEEYARIRSKETPVEEKERLVLSQIGELFRLSERVDAVRLASSGTDEASRREIMRVAESRERFRDWYGNVVQERGIDLFFCDFDKFKNRSYRFAETYHDYARRTAHPYMDPSSSTESHGTHVSGIILAQEDEARIVPVRVITASRTTTPEIEQPVKTGFLREFEQWLRIPIVNAAVSELIARKTDDLDSVPADAPNRVDLTTEIIMNRVREVFPASFENNRLDYFFFNEIKEAIKYVGESRIKLANVSLGAEFSQRGTRVDETEDTRFEDLFEFLVFEYFKYTVGDMLNRHASNTLFVIAAGNSGAWLDGRSRSGLPCDLSSPFLEKHEEVFGSRVPNNRVNNILCVGSINADHELSAFTNILLTQVPFVVAKGEAIPSAVRSEDCEGVSQEVSRRLGPAPQISVTLLGDTEFEQFLTSEGHLREGMDEVEKEKVKLRGWLRYYGKAILMSQITDVAHRHECVAGDYLAMARMSGTSMASPAVAGRMARLVNSKMQALGMTDSEIYTHPDFSPTTLINELASGSPVFGGSSIISQLRKIVDTRDYPAESQGVEIRQLQLGSTGGGTTVMIK